jgi:catechol 2,3-dioxygenase-like lactoylglutathione lyase family enzyme
MNRLVLAAALVFTAGLAHAQPAQNSPSGPAPTGLAVGSGNFYSPIVANLEEAIRFYRDGVGFEFQGEPANADANPQLRAMFGLPDARLRYQIGRAPGIQGGVEIIEISGAGGQPLGRRIQEPGAVMLIVEVRDVDAALARVKAQGTKIVTRGGKPIEFTTGLRAAVVQDPAGHFVELVQQPAASAAGTGTGDIRNVRVRHTVANLDRAVGLYRDALGLKGGGDVPASYSSAPPVLEVLALAPATSWRLARLIVPTSGLPIELMEFKDARRPQPADLADPGATRIQLRVADIDAAVAALTKAGGTFVSTGGKPLDLPAGNRSLKVGIVRDPDDLFLVLIDTPPER